LVVPGAIVDTHPCQSMNSCLAILIAFSMLRLLYALLEFERFLVVIFRWHVRRSRQQPMSECGRNWNEWVFIFEAFSYAHTTWL